MFLILVVRFKLELDFSNFSSLHSDVTVLYADIRNVRVLGSFYLRLTGIYIDIYV